MINILSVKWGTKYSSEEVNRLYKMVNKNLTIPFKFYCFTEDPNGLDKNINIIYNQEHDYLDGVWNKMPLFNSKLMPDGINLYFDIDIIIQNNIDYLIDYLNPNKLTKVYAFWKEMPITDGSPKNLKEQWDMNYNSSIMLWKNGALDYIWEHFNKNPDNYMIKYRGIDRFIFHELGPSEFFPKGTIYSRIHGKDIESKNEYIDLIYRNFNFQEYAYYYPEYKICLFNGPVIEEHYKGFEKYYK